METTTSLKKATHAAVTGTKGKLARKAEDPIAKRTPLSADTIRTLFGALFLFLAARTLFKSVRAALR
jgi:hypothetical protein